MKLRHLIAFGALLIALATAALAQSLTLTNLKGPIARAAGTREAKSISELWTQIASLPAKVVEPAPTPTSAPAPTLAGVAAVASGLDVSRFLQPSWGTGAIATSGAPDVVGAFRFSCTPSHNGYNDPIIFWKQPGKSHLHTFFGNTLTDANSTFESLRKTGDSTCNNALNRSAYWVAAMMTGTGMVVMPSIINIYYKGIPSGSPQCREMGRACVPLPKGLRYVFGYNMQDPAKSHPIAARWWSCDAPNAGGHFASITEALKKCPVGAPLGQVLFSPDCWNGTELDSPDHRSHMAYAAYGADGKPRCPSTHPYVIPQFTLGAWYKTDATSKDWYLSSDRMPGMPDAEPGTTLHTDWFGAWEDSVADRWQKNCIDKLLSCSGGDLGDGKQMTNTASTALAGAVVAAPARPN